MQSEYVGCYSDVPGDRDLPFDLLRNIPGGMTRRICSTHCANKVGGFTLDILTMSTITLLPIICLPAFYHINVCEHMIYPYTGLATAATPTV